MTREELIADIMQRRGAPSTGSDIAQSLLPGAADAVASIPGAPVDIANLAMKASAWLANRLPGTSGTMEAPQIPDRFGSSAGIREGINQGGEAISPGLGEALRYQSQGMPGRLARGAVGMGGAAAGPGAMLGATLRQTGRMGALGGGAGAGVVGADAAMGEMGVPQGPRDAINMGLGFSTMALGNRANAVPLNAARMLRERTSALSPAEFAAAQQREGLAARGGVPLIGGEAFGPMGGQVQGLTSDIRSTAQGGLIDLAINRRQGQVQQAVAGPQGPNNFGFLDRVSPDADPAIPAGLRTAATHPDYVAADMQNVPAAAIDPILQQAAGAGARTGIGALDEYARDIGGAARPGNQYQLGPLSTIYQDTRDNIARPNIDPRAVTQRTRGELGEINPQLNTALEQANPTYQRAQQNFRDMSPRVDAAQTRADFVEQFGSPTGALNAGGSQPTNPTVGARFAQDVRGRTGPGALQAAKFDQRITQAADARGTNAPVMVREINDFLDNLSLTNQIPGVGSRTASRGGMAAESEANIGSKLARALNLTKGSVLDIANNASAGFTGRRTRSILAEALSAPNGVERIMEMLSTAPASRLRQIQAGNLAAAIKASQQSQTERTGGR